MTRQAKGKTASVLPGNWIELPLERFRKSARETVDPRRYPNEFFELYSVPSHEVNLPEIKTGNEIGSSKQIVHEGDVLLCGINPRINRVWIVGNHSAHAKIASSEWLVFSHSTILTPEYLRCFLQNPGFRSHLTMNVSGIGGSLTRVNKDAVFAYRIPVPPLIEQRRIVEKIVPILSRSNKTRMQTERISKLMNGFYLSSVSNLFGAHALKEMMASGTTRKSVGISAVALTHDGLTDDWRTLNLEEIVSFIGSGITPRGGRGVYRKEGIPFIRSQNVYPEGIRREGLVFVTEELHNKMSRTHVKTNDVLLNITGASIGRSTYVRPEFSPANVNQHVCILRPLERIMPQYLSAFLNSPDGQAQIMSFQKGQTREGLNYSQIRRLAIPVAPMPVQERIVADLELRMELREMIKAQMRTIGTEVTRFESSVLSYAFAGELVAQDPRDEAVRGMTNENSLLARLPTDRRRSAR